MRISRLLLIVLLLASSYGCSEEEPDEVEKNQFLYGQETHGMSL